MDKIKILLLTAITFSSLHGFAQSPYKNDRVYTGNQVSNTVSVIDPSQNKLLGEIKLGNPYPNVLTPLYKGQTLVHGLRYCPKKKLLAVVSIGSNSVTFISTENNKIIRIVYVGRSPHEPTFTPDSKQVWVSVRGEGYISVIDVDKMEEIKKIPVADGPGMVAFSPDGEFAYVCSSFTPELDIIRTKDYTLIKRIDIASPFSPNIFTSPDGNWVALTLKDIGAVVVINAITLEVVKQINTGGITNHVTFSNLGKLQRMFVTVGAENKVRVFDVTKDFIQTDTVDVGALPHGLWPSDDGKLMYIGLEYGDEVQAIDLVTLKVTGTIKIGQSPQALVYAGNAVYDYTKSLENLKPLQDTTATQIITLNSLNGSASHGRLAVRPVGVTDLIEQIFTGLIPGNSYTLAFSKSMNVPFANDYEVNHFVADVHGKFGGQSAGLVKSAVDPTAQDYKHIILIDNNTKETVLLDNLNSVTSMRPETDHLNNRNMNPKGVLSVQSRYPVRETADRLEKILHSAGATVYARIDQQAELEKAGLDIRPMEFLLFGNPAAGGPVIMQDPLVALDLPLKLLVFENEQNETWIISNEASYIGERFGLAASTYAPFILDKIIQKAISN